MKGWVVPSAPAVRTGKKVAVLGSGPAGWSAAAQLNRAGHTVTVEIKWGKNDKGQFVPTEVPGTEKTRPAQLVLLAMGFLGPEQALLKDLNLETDPRSNIKAEHEKYTTSIKGIFAAGDCRRGQSLVVWAINEGRGAARVCDR